MDCSVVATKYKDLYLVSTTDFFYPLVEDPYFQGRVAACNVLSDIYAMGCVEVDTVLMILGVCKRMTPEERDIVTTRMIKGFVETCTEAGTSCTGGQTVINPWPIIGGVASSLRAESDMIRPIHGVAGDVIVLTKPLGTQIAVNAQEWRRQPHNWAKIKDVVTEEQVLEAFLKASDAMCQLNLIGAQLMHKYKAHGATDVTGFGILGHLQNLNDSQTADVSLELTRLPILANMLAVEKARNNMFKLVEGYSAETSGGLLLMLPAESAEAYCKEYKELAGTPAWIVGRVVKGDGKRKASIVADVECLEV